MTRFLRLITACMVFAAGVSCTDQQSQDEINTQSATGANAVMQPEGRFVVRDALLRARDWKNKDKYRVPFTELVFDASRLEVEVLDEDADRTSFRLNTMGNGVYELDSVWRLEYDHIHEHWTIKAIEENGMPFRLDRTTLPDTAKMSGVSAFKFQLQQSIIAGTYQVADKEGKFHDDQVIHLTADGQVVGAKGLARYNLLVNGPIANCELMPMELYNNANDVVLIVGVAVNGPFITLYKLTQDTPESGRSHFRAAEVYSRLQKVVLPE